jgi:hypothetical protein
MQRIQAERLLGAVGVVVALGIGFWWGKSSRRAGAGEELDGVSREGRSARSSVTGEAKVRPGEVKASAAAAKTAKAVSPAEAMRAEVLRALREPNLTTRVVRLAAVLQNLSAENWQGMLAAFAEEKTEHGRKHDDVRMLFAQRAGEVVGLAALGHFLGAKDDEATRAALTGWAIGNPAAALEWLGKGADAETRRKFIGAAIRGLALTEPDLAIAELESIPIERRKNYTNRFMDSLVRTAGMDGAEVLLGGMIKRAAAANTLQDDYLVGVFWDFAQQKISQARTTGNVPEVAEWLRQHLGQPYVHSGVVAGVVESYVNVDPLKAAQWLETYNRDNIAAGHPKYVGYDVLMRGWTAKEGLEAPGRWLGGMTAHPHYDRMTQRYAEAVAVKDPTGAMRWANTIRDAALKAEAISNIRNTPAPQPRK